MRHKPLLLLAIVCSLAATNSASADAISDWNERAVAFVTNRQMPPPQAERVMAMVHAAMFDAVNSVERRYRPFLLQLPASATASKDAAAAVAASTVLAGLHPEAEGEFKSALATYLTALPNNGVKSEGIDLGQRIAARILEARASDGSQAADTYRPQARPGVYVPTAMTVGSVWPKLKPFLIAEGSQFRPQPPVALNSEQWAVDYNEIKVLGGRNSTKRSARQTEDARFWLSPGPAIYYPIVRQIAAAKKLDIVDSARFLALIAVARSDAFVAIFDAKYHYDFWRPVTAIRNGDMDNNPATERDASWQPVADTPMHPEYPCAHCIMAATIASVVETVFGTADIAEVTLTSPTAPGITRRWSNVWALTSDVSQARIVAGFHYRFSTRAGEDMGRRIGQYVVNNAMQITSVAGVSTAK
jgi:hypothetical protein